MVEKLGKNKLTILMCFIIFFSVILLSAGIDALEENVADGADKNLSFVTECGASTTVTSYVMGNYEKDDTVVRSGEQGCGKMSFTCNVDWGEEVIPDMLKIFDEKDMKITFFVTGSWASKHPDLLREMYLKGHEIGSHGYGHKMCSQISDNELRSELEKTEKAIDDAIGIRPRYFAPPSGDFNEKTVNFCRANDYRMILWSADTIDWREGSTAEVIHQRIMSKELDGAVVLMHPKEETVKALPGMIDAIREKGIQPVKLSQMIEPQKNELQNEQR